MRNFSSGIRIKFAIEQGETTLIENRSNGANPFTYTIRGSIVYASKCLNPHRKTIVLSELKSR